jgi:hypothetical protein
MWCPVPCSDIKALLCGFFHGSIWLAFSCTDGTLSESEKVRLCVEADVQNPAADSLWTEGTCGIQSSTS